MRRRTSFLLALGALAAGSAVSAMSAIGGDVPASGQAPSAKAGAPGGVEIPVGEEFHPVRVATVGEDGSVTIRCVDPATAKLPPLSPGVSAPPFPRSVLATARGVSASGLTIQINNRNGAGTGFNDPTPRSPAGGNAGTTLGAQRLLAFQFAASLWAPKLTSAATIAVDATFEALPCSSTSAVLGSAGTQFIYRDYAYLPRSATWYPAALAGKYKGAPMSASAEIVARFNTALDDGSCGFPRALYYGLDAAPPAGAIDLVSVVFHELGHGLGFQTFVDGASGARKGDGSGAYDDVYMVYLSDGSTGKTWTSMTDPERAASATNSGNLVWSGPAAAAKAPSVLVGGLGPGGKPRLYAPSTYAAGSSLSHWDTALSPNELMEPTYTSAIHDLLVTGELMQDIGWGASATPASSWFLPSSARAGGQGGAFYTTDLTVANRSQADTTITLKFLDHDVDGRSGAELTFNLGAGRAATYGDVLGNVFNVTSGYGAIRISSPSASLNILGQTSKPGGGGTFGQSVPAVAPADLITPSSPRSIVAVREDATFRTNLILVNTTEAPLVVDVALLDGTGAQLASGSYSLAPLGMRQVPQVVRDLAIPSNLTNAQLLLSTRTSGGAFGAYASVIDIATNDPRTLLPR